MSCDNSTISWMEQWFERLMMRLSKWRPGRCKPVSPPALPWFRMCRCRNNLFRWPVAIALLFPVCSPGVADDGQALDRFLTRLGLSDLRLANMERMLARETVLEKRQTMARAPADRYAGEWNGVAD